MTITEDSVVHERTERDATRHETGAWPAHGIRLDVAYTAVFFVLGWAVGIGRLNDNSFFLHLRTGRLILERGIPHADPYSFTAHGVSWIAQSWLAELVYGVLDRVAGAGSIRFFGAIVAAVIAALIYRLALRLTRDRVRALGLGVAAYGCIFAFWAQRPMVLGTLSFLALVWLVEVPDGWAGRRAPYLLPPLMWFWANVHGSFALGFLFLALHLGGRWLEGEVPWRGRERGLLVGALVGGAACFVNPYGPALVLFPIELLGRGDVLAKVVEWRSPDFRTFQGQMLAVWLVVLVAAMARGSRRASRRDLLVAIPFVLLALWAQRNVPLAVLATLPVVARTIARPAPGAGVEDDEPRIAWLPVTLVLVFALLYTSVDAVTGPAFDFSGNPVAAMHAVERAGLLGRRVAEPDGWGGYVALKYWPRQPVFMDDRFDMYPVPFIRREFALSDAQQWRSTLARSDVEVVVWPVKESLPAVLDESPDWVRLSRDRTAAVFVRRDVAQRSGITR